MFRVTGHVDHHSIIDGVTVQDVAGDYTSGIMITTEINNGFTAIIRNNVIDDGTAVEKSYEIRIIDTAINSGSFMITIESNKSGLSKHKEMGLNLIHTFYSI